MFPRTHKEAFMPKVVEFVTFKLNEGVSEQQLLATSDEFNESFLSLQKGYISRKLIRDGNIWSDIVLWETMEDAMSAVKACENNPAVGSYFKCIEESSCTMRHFSIVKNY